MVLIGFEPSPFWKVNHNNPPFWKVNDIKPIGNRLKHPYRIMDLPSGSQKWLGNGGFV